MDPADHEVIEQLAKAWRTLAKRPAAADEQGTCLVCIYPIGPDMGLCYSLGNAPAILGRAEDCTLCVRDHTVSRQHTRIESREDGFYVVDLQSTNGTFVNEVRTTAARLQNGDNLRLGNTIYRFLTGDIQAAYQEEIYRLSIKDGLTGIYSRRYFMDALDREVARSVQFDRPLGLVRLAVDHFGEITEKLGPLVGDATLRELAARLNLAIRKSDLIARLDGEDFAVILVEADRDQTRLVAERLRAIVEKHTFQYGGESYQVTICAGAVSTRGNAVQSAIEFLRLAQQNLAQARGQGPNCVAG